MNSKNDIAVIIRFHRIDKFLQDAIDSVLESKKVKVKLILIGNTEIRDKGILDIPTSTEFVCGKKNQINYDLKEILKESNADFVGSLDSDDLCHPLRLTSQISALRRSGAVLSICGIRRIGADGKSKLHQPPIFSDMKILSLMNLLGAINANSSWVWESQQYLNSLDYPGGTMSPDWNLALTLKESTTKIFTPERLYFYRQHNGQMTRTCEYRNKAFRLIFPIWKRKNEEYGFPDLSFAEASCVAAPWSEHGTRTAFPWHWVRAFLASTDIITSRDYYRILQLICWRFTKKQSIDFARLISKDS